MPRGQGREALCAALVRIVARDGFDAVTFRSVAAEAGVTHGLASYHFGTRERLIEEALAWAAERAIAGSRFGEPGQLDELGSEVPAVVADAPEEAAFQFALALEAARRPVLRAAVRESYEAYVDAVAVSLERLGFAQDRALARLVFAAFDGIALQQLVFGDTARSAETIGALHKLLHTRT